MNTYLKRVVSLSAACLLLAAESPADQIDPSDPGSLVEHRISAAERELADLVSGDPLREIVVNAFFARHSTINEAMAIAKAQGVKLRGFRHQSVDSNGGYSLAEDETPARAAQRYVKDHEFFMDEDARLAREAMDEARTDGDAELEQALEARLARIRTRKLAFDQFGIQVVGVELQGNAKKLAEMPKRHKLIRFVELKVPGRPDPSVTP